MKIMIDAGHSGKYNPSPGCPGYYESEMVWKLHKYWIAELSKYNKTL